MIASSRCNTGDMTIKRLDHVSVVVDDLAAASAFFTALGMTLEDEMPVEGPWVDRVNGLESVQHCRSPARQRRRTRRRGGPVRGQVPTLLHARPCGHHRRAGRGTLLKRFTTFGETGGALGAPATRSLGSHTSCFLAYLRRGFVRRTKTKPCSSSSDMRTSQTSACCAYAAIASGSVPKCGVERDPEFHRTGSG